MSDTRKEIIENLAKNCDKNEVKIPSFQMNIAEHNNFNLKYDIVIST
jgi:hypothetical protein